MCICRPGGRLICKALVAKTSWASSTSVGMHLSLCCIRRKKQKKQNRFARRRLMKESRLIRLTSGTTALPVGGWKTLWGEAVGETRGLSADVRRFLNVTFFGAKTRHKCALLLGFSYPSQSHHFLRLQRVIASFPCFSPLKSFCARRTAVQGNLGVLPNPAWALLMCRTTKSGGGAAIWCLSPSAMQFLC